MYIYTLTYPHHPFRICPFFKLVVVMFILQTVILSQLDLTSMPLKIMHYLSFFSIQLKCKGKQFSTIQAIPPLNIYSLLLFSSTVLQSHSKPSVASFSSSSVASSSSARNALLAIDKKCSHCNNSSLEPASGSGEILDATNKGSTKVHRNVKARLRKQLRRKSFDDDVHKHGLVNPYRERDLSLQAKRLQQRARRDFLIGIESSKEASHQESLVRTKCVLPSRLAARAEINEAKTKLRKSIDVLDSLQTIRSGTICERPSIKTIQHKVLVRGEFLKK